MPKVADVNAAWLSLFDPLIPDAPVLRSVFAGRCPGVWSLGDTYLISCS